MTSALYDLGRKAFLDADIDLLVDDIKVILIDSDDYAENLVTDEFLSNIPGAARVDTSGNLAGKTTTGGVFDANDITFTAVVGDQAEALVIYEDTGVEGTSRLICFIDNAAEFPITPNGNDITVIWDSGANKIFKI